MRKESPKARPKLRSQSWFGRDDRDALVHRSWMKNQGFPHSDRGWVKLYCETVTQAEEGVDLDFLVGKSGARVGWPSH